MVHLWEYFTTEEQINRLVDSRDPRETECLCGHFVAYGPSFLRDGYEGRTPCAKSLAEHEEVRGFELQRFKESW